MKPRVSSLKRPRKLGRPAKGTSEKTEIIKIDEDITTNILEVKKGLKEKSMNN